jgi:hypothetical protein
MAGVLAPVEYKPKASPLCQLVQSFANPFKAYILRHL